MKFLIIEDEVEIAEYVKQGLEENGETADMSHDGLDGLRKLEEGYYDFVILDIRLPKMEGWQVLEELRKFNKSIPVLILSACDDALDRIRGLEQGADDYINKPFVFAELLTRIRAIERRRDLDRQNVIQLGKLIIDLTSRRVTYNKTPIKLTRKEFELLLEFINSQDELVTREHLAQKIWGEEKNIESNVVDVTVHRLRAKLTACMQKRIISTVRGTGYIFSYKA